MEKQQQRLRRLLSTQHLLHVQGYLAFLGHASARAGSRMRTRAPLASFAVRRVLLLLLLLTASASCAHILARLLLPRTKETRCFLPHFFSLSHSFNRRTIAAKVKKSRDETNGSLPPGV